MRAHTRTTRDRVRMRARAGVRRIRRGERIVIPPWRGVQRWCEGARGCVLRPRSGKLGGWAAGRGEGRRTGSRGRGCRGDRRGVGEDLGLRGAPSVRGVLPLPDDWLKRAPPGTRREDGWLANAEIWAEFERAFEAWGLPLDGWTTTKLALRLRGHPPLGKSRMLGSGNAKRRGRYGVAWRGDPGSLLLRP